MKKSLSIFLMVLLFCTSINLQSGQAEVKENYKLYVMAPLTEITDWGAFEQKLIQLKNSGVYGLTTDVWWGVVEGKADNQFDWSYYERYAEAVRKSGLKWVPIMSTHQCGGNVGDDCNYPIPQWLIKENAIEDIAFKSETGHINTEALAPWWKGIGVQYEEFYRAFAMQFAEEEQLIEKIYLSSGPAGELRYPSYQFADGWEWPERGQFQAYSEGAKKSFQKSMKMKYKKLSKLNQSWKTSYRSWKDIAPPADGDAFFTEGDYQTRYGKDFMAWYQGMLEKHVTTISKAAHKQFDPVFDVPIGVKISGVHWKMNDPDMPHSAEYSAGYSNYGRLLDQIKKLDLALTFTCLEMDDGNAQTAPYYSAPKSLVIQIATLANERDISLNGENALAMVNNEYGFDNAAEMVFNYGFDGFTLLRMDYLFDQNGKPTAEFGWMKDKLALKALPVTVQAKNVPETARRVFITGNRAEIGRWKPETYPYELTKKKTGEWKGTFQLAADRHYLVKLVYEDAQGKLVWQEGLDRPFTTPGSGKEVWTANW